MRFLITGGQGTMAQTIREKLEKNCYGFIYAPPRSGLDITNEHDVEMCMKIWRPDVLINVAGYINPTPIKDTSYEEWKKHIDINCNGVFLCSKYAVENGCQTIITIGSTSAFEGRKDWGAYCASKSCILSITETLAEEGYLAYSLNPARTETKMRERLFPNEDKTTLMKPERVAEFVIKILDREFANGSHIILKKDRYYVLPKRVSP
jgi:NAD(P)-dependent dehydrogenase (short-subunit alcohol dehydrogenase family)